MAHRTAYEGSPPKRPVDVVSRTEVDRAGNAPRTSSVPIAGHDNGGHQVFWVGTMQHRFRKMVCVRVNVVTDVVYPEHDGVRQRTRDTGKVSEEECHRTRDVARSEASHRRPSLTDPAGSPLYHRPEL